MSAALFQRNLAGLTTAQILFFMCNTMVVSTSPLVGATYAPDRSLATLPLAMQFLGTMLSTMPISLLMRRIGRRRGLQVGMLGGVVAGLLGALAIHQASFWLFMGSSLLYGSFMATGQYFRFTAADAADQAKPADPIAARGRAIAIVMTGGIVAAVLGPEAAKATQNLLPPFVFMGCYVTIAVFATGALVFLQLLKLAPLSAAERREGGRPIVEIMLQRRAVTAVLAAIVGYVTMNLLMTATPLAMFACGYAFADSALVIQWHVLGMFAPSFITGRLITRFGVERVILAGVFLNVVCLCVALAGVHVANFAIALCLLGVGWNFMFVGGTTLLTACYTPSERAKVQGLNELLVFGSVTCSAALAGALHEQLGWDAMNLLALPGLLLVALVILVLRPGAPRLMQPRGA